MMVDGSLAPRFATWAALMVVCVVPAQAEPPSITSVSPRAVAPAGITDLVIRGKGMPDATGLWTSFPSEVAAVPRDPDEAAKNDTALFHVTVPAGVVPGIYGVRILSRDGVSPLALIAVDDLPTVARASDNKSPDKAQPLTVPCAVDGSLDWMKAHFYRISVAADQRVSMEVLARRLGSKMDPVLRVLDANGREIAFSDDMPGLDSDSRLVHTFKDPGDYTIEIRDVRYFGGDTFPYRLRLGDFPDISVPFPMGVRQGQAEMLQFAGRDTQQVLPVEVHGDSTANAQWMNMAAKREGGQSSTFATLVLSNSDEFVESEPNDDPANANRVPIGASLNGRLQAPSDTDSFVFHASKDQHIAFSGLTRRLGSPADLYLQLLDPEGKQVAFAEDAGAYDGVLKYKFPADADYTLVVRDLNRRGGPEYAYRITAAAVQPGFSLSAESDAIDVPAGGTAMITVSATRDDYNGPIHVMAADLPKGVTQVPTVIGPGQRNVALTLKCAADAAVGGFSLTHIAGMADGASNDRTVTASIAAALSKRFNGLPFPPPTLSENVAVVVTPPAPFNLRAEPSAVVFGPNLSATIQVIVERTAGFDDQIFLVAAPQKGGLPNGVTAKLTPVPKGQSEIEVTLAANDKAALGTYSVVLAGVLKKNKSIITQPAPGMRIELRPAFTFRIEGSDPKVSLGGETKVKIRVDRNPAFSGPITVSAKNLPKGTVAAEVTIPAESVETELVLKAEADATAGEAQPIIRGEAKLKDAKLSGESPPLRLVVE